MYSNGHFVSRQSDYIIYSVEAEHIDSVVAIYGPCKYQIWGAGCGVRGGANGAQRPSLVQSLVDRRRARRQRLPPSRNTFLRMLRSFPATHSMDPTWMRVGSRW